MVFPRRATLVKSWSGSKPVCDFCSTDAFDRLIEGKKDAVMDTFVDGKTKMGPWALMCESCFSKYGVGLGTGLGQRYDAKTLLKIEG